MSDSWTVETERSDGPPVKRRRRWFRFLYQFSLRTMLLAMTLAAVACWWFFRPPVHVEELAGRYLTLRRQVRMTPVEDGSAPIAGEEVTAIASVGWWQLLDENNDVLVNGRYDNDLPHGKWTLWHANGRKAAEGQAFRGARTGAWRVWDEHGTLRSEVTYRALAPRPAAGIGGATASAIGTGPRGVMMIGPVGQLAPPYTSTAQLPATPDRYVSERHGSCRVWYASGQLQLEGQYADDRRDGPWTFYDEQGSVTEKGAYKEGLRDGEWLIAGTKPGPGGSDATMSGDPPGASFLPAKFTYVAGRTRDDHAALLARLAADLAGGSVRRQVAAATRLVELGPSAIPILTAAIDGDRPETKILALRSLMRLAALTPDLLPKIEPLVDHADPRLALRAMLAVYELAPQRRSKLYPQIMKLLDQSSRRELAALALVQICNLDADRRLLAFMSLIERLADGVPPGWIIPADMAAIQQLRVDAAPLLVAAFGHRDPQVRIYVLLVLEHLFRTGRVERSALQPVLDKAKSDPDPEVRGYGERVPDQAAGGFF